MTPRTENMKPRQVISAVICSLIQILIFGYMWDLLSELAENLGREIRVGYRISFGISTYYEFKVLSVIMVLTAFLSASNMKLKYRVGVVFSTATLWFFFLVVPEFFGSHPIRGSSFGLLGLFINVLGNCILIIMQQKKAKLKKGLIHDLVIG